MDRAVSTFGTALQGDLDAVEGKNGKEIDRKRSLILAKYFPSTGGRFRDPGKGRSAS